MTSCDSCGGMEFLLSWMMHSMWWLRGERARLPWLGLLLSACFLESDISAEYQKSNGTYRSGQGND